MPRRELTRREFIERTSVGLAAAQLGLPTAKGMVSSRRATVGNLDATGEPAFEGEAGAGFARHT